MSTPAGPAAHDERILVPDLNGVPEDDSAEPDDADVAHTASVEDVGL